MEKIKVGLIQCLVDKPLTKVSVSDIAATSNVTRATFYRLFDTPTDVMAFTCDDLFVNAERKLSAEKGSDSDKIIQLFAFLTENANSIEAIFKSRRADLFQDSLDKFFERTSPDYSHNYQTPDKEYYLAAVSSVLSSIIFTWIQFGRKESPEELYRIFQTFKRL